MVVNDNAQLGVLVFNNDFHRLWQVGLDHTGMIRERSHLLNIRSYGLIGFLVSAWSASSPIYWTLATIKWIYEQLIIYPKKPCLK